MSLWPTPRIGEGIIFFVQILPKSILFAIGPNCNLVASSESSIREKKSERMGAICSKICPPNGTNTGKRLDDDAEVSVQPGVALLPMGRSSPSQSHSQSTAQGVFRPPETVPEAKEDMPKAEPVAALVEIPVAKDVAEVEISTVKEEPKMKQEEANREVLDEIEEKKRQFEAKIGVDSEECEVDGADEDLDKVADDDDNLSTLSSSMQLRKSGPYEVERQESLSSVTSDVTKTLAELWESDAAVTNCRICTKAFGLMLRKHHCRNCGRVVCDPCSKKKAFVKRISKTKLQRVCDQCFAEEELPLTIVPDIQVGVTSPVTSESSPSTVVVTSPDSLDLPVDIVGRRKSSGTAKSKACQICSRNFTFALKSHFCKNCGMDVCAQCSQGRAFLPEVDPKRLVRVCEDCKNAGNLVFSLPDGVEPAVGRRSRSDSIGSDADSVLSASFEAKRRSIHERRPSDDGSVSSLGSSFSESQILSTLHGPLAWEPDHASDICRVCAQAFSLARRKHHCRACGKLVCHSCSSKSVVLPLLKKKDPVRVCEPCFKEYTVTMSGSRGSISRTRGKSAESKDRSASIDSRGKSPSPDSRETSPVADADIPSALTSLFFQ